MQAEEEHVLVAETFVHLNVCAVERADSHGAVHHQLHAAGAGGFLARGGYLLGHLRGGDYGLGRGDAVVLHKVDLQPTAADGVVVDILGHGQQQLDYALCGLVARGGLRAEHKGARDEVHVRVVVQLELEARNAHRAEKLALVLVQTLYLHVHYRVGVEGEAVVAHRKFREAVFVLKLYLIDAAEDFAVGSEFRKLFEPLRLKQIRVAAEQLAYQTVQAGIYLAEPAAMVDAVGDGGEAIRTDGVDIVEQVIFQDLAVQAGNAVDLVAGGEAEVCHVHLIVADDEVAADALALAEVLHQIVAPAAVYLAHDLPQARQQLLHDVLRPLLERLAHNGVVGVGDGMSDNVPRLVPAETVFVHEYAHQLGDYQCRVGVVYLHCVVLGERLDIAPLADVLAHNVLRGRGDKEVLLLETQDLALDVLIGRVENFGYDLGHSALLHALDIFALGEEVHVERVGAFRIPQAQGVYLVSTVTRDEHVARDGDDGGITGVFGVIVPHVVPVRGDVPAEADLDGVLPTGDEPALGRGTPVVGDLGLAAVFKLLAENSQLVADGIARALVAAGGHAVHIAGGETAKTAVAETRVRLGLEDVGRIAAKILKRAGDGFGYA